MADFTAIADVSQTFIDLLTEGLASLGTEVKLDDLQKLPPASNLLTLFLFQIREEGHLRNRPTQTRQVDSKVILQKPSLSIVVQYLFTPWAAKHDDNQRILGLVMQTLYDHAIITGTALKGSLAEKQEDVHVSLVSLTLEDQLRVWHSLNKPYRLSLHYEARVIHIDSLSTTITGTVRSRHSSSGDA